MATMIWKFVDQPVAAPNVALDMNQPGGSIVVNMSKDFRVDSPPLRRSTNPNTMSDGQILTSASFDNRELDFTISFQGDVTAKAANVGKLFAELAKPANLLMYKPNASTPPVFFRTLRSDDFAFVNRGGSKGAWDVSCKVMAEPFALGTRVDAVTGAVITNNPTSGTNAQKYDLPTVVGDAPTPAFIRFTTLANGDQVIIAQRTVNNPTALTLFAQAETGTLGTDVTLPGNDALMSGTGSNYARTSFTTQAGLISRVNFTIPTFTVPEALRGRYRVFARIRQSAATLSTYQLRYRAGAADFFYGPTIAWDGNSTTNFTHLDLGIIELPLVTSAPISSGYSGLSLGYASPNIINIQASRLSGTASLDIDYMYLMPADERMSAVSQVTSSGYLILDGPNDMTYSMAAGTTPFGATRTVDNAGGLVPRIGGLPLLVPNRANRWHILVSNASITSTLTMDVSYWPRWLEVATS